MAGRKSEWVLRLMGAACFAAVILLWLMSRVNGSGTGYEVILMGDSVVGNQYWDLSVDEELSEKTGLEVFNGAFGGSGVVPYNDGFWESQGSEAFSFEALVNAIILGDFSAQDSAIERNTALEYFPDRLQALRETDFSEADILVISYGANDYANQVSPEVFEETLGSCIGKLKAAYPELTIYISSSVYNYLVRDGEQILCDSGEWGEYLLEDYVLAQERVAERYGVCFIDNYHDSVINADTVYDYTVDGLHLRPAGQDVLTDAIAAAVLSGALKETD